MISREELDEAIKECIENPRSTQVCQALASFYIIKDKLYPDNEMPIMEYSYSNEEKISAYDDYVKIKKEFQQGVESEEHLLRSFDAYAVELKNLLRNIYASADTPSEREHINKLITDIQVGNF